MYPTFKKLCGKRIVLATTSPRRIEMFRHVGLPVDCMASGFEEDKDWRDFESHLAYVYFNARNKASAFLENPEIRSTTSLVIGADTILELDGEVYEKPLDRDDAKRMLRKFCNRPVNVFTAVTLLYKDQAGEFRECSFHDEGQIVFADYDDPIIEGYLDFGHGMDAAGALRLHTSMLLHKEFRGNFENLLGFPMLAFYTHLTKIVNLIH